MVALERLSKQQTTAGGPPPVQGGARTFLFAAGAILLLTFVAYLPAIRADFIWDDDDYITRNATLTSLDGLRRIWCELGAVPQYYPLVHTTFWIEHKLWGFWPSGYHLTNVLLHAMSAVILWRILRRLEVPGAWAAAAVFALHPVCVESVAWITERKNVLSGVFYLAGVLAALRFAGFGSDRPDTRTSYDWRFYPVVILLFGGAVLSKTVAASMPAAVLLVFWWKKGRLDRHDWLAMIPLLAAGLAMGQLTAWMERHRVGAMGQDWALSFVDRCLIAGRAVWFYLGKLVWPTRLTFVYPRWVIDSTAAWQYLFPLGVLVALAALWMLRRRIGRGPLVAALFFGGTLLPALGFVNIYPMRYTFVADHYQYLASIGPIVLGVAFFASRRQSDGSAPGWRRPLGVAVLMLLSLLDWRQTRIYANEETLWRDTIAKNPHCWMAHSNLGGILEHSGRFPDAAICFTESLRIRPDDYQLLNNLANVLAKMGRLAEASERYSEALRRGPNDARVHHNLAGVLATSGRIDEAIRHYRVAIQLQPDLSDSYGRLADLMAARGQTDEAMSLYSRAIDLRPEGLGPLNNLSWLLATRPGARPGDAARAVFLAERACELTRHAQPMFLDTLAAAYAAAHRYDEAVRAARQAAALFRSAGQRAQADAVETRLRLYAAGRSYVQSPT